MSLVDRPKDQFPQSSQTTAEMDVEILKIMPRDFAVDCHEHANWVVRKIVETRDYADRVMQWADREAARAAREETTLLFLFGRQLEAWAKTQIEETGGKRKSVPLPAGTVGIRASQPKMVIDDEESVLSWAKANCAQAIIVVERISKSVLDQYVEQTGSVPDAGIHIEPSVERFYVK